MKTTGKKVGKAKPARAPEGMAGIAKGLAIIECFGPKYPRLTLADAARLTGQTRATARRCLLTLLHLGYVDFDGKYYRPEPRLLRLGSAYLSSVQLPQIAQSIMDRIRDQTNESISLSIMESDEMVYIARASVSRVLLTGAAIGVRVPAYCTAGGRIWLANLPDDELKAYLARTQLVKHTHFTVTNPHDLEMIIRKARADGYGITDQETELGVRAVGVAVRSSSGQIIAVMTVGTSAARMTLESLINDLLPPLQAGADALSKAY